MNSIRAYDKNVLLPPKGNITINCTPLYFSMITGFKAQLTIYIKCLFERSM